MTEKPGAHFTNDFSIVIQIRCKISFCTHPRCSEMLTKKLTHDMTCCHNILKILLRYNIYNGGALKTIFYWIWIMMENSIVKWSPGDICQWAGSSLVQTLPEPMMTYSPKQFFWNVKQYTKLFFQALHFLMLSTKLWPLCLDFNVLTHYGLLTHTTSQNMVIIGSYNALLPI